MSRVLKIYLKNTTCRDAIRVSLRQPRFGQRRPRREINLGNVPDGVYTMGEPGRRVVVWVQGGYVQQQSEPTRDEAHHAEVVAQFKRDFLGE